MTRQEIIEKRDKFVEQLKKDIENNLDFDFTRPEMGVALLDKYYGDVSFFLGYDQDVANLYVPTDKEKPENRIQIKIKNVEETQYTLEVIHDTVESTTSKRYNFNKKKEDVLDYDDEGFICMNGVRRKYILSKYYDGYWFLNVFTKSTVNFIVDSEVIKTNFNHFKVKNLEDYIDRLENHLWLPPEK